MVMGTVPVVMVLLQLCFIGGCQATSEGRCGIDPEILNKDNKRAEDILLEDKPPGWEEMLTWYNKFKPGLWRAMLTTKPNNRLVERLLQSWCRVTIMKNGIFVNLRVMAQQNPYHIHCQRLMEKYENTIEFALACLSGRPSIIKTWISTNWMHNIDVNTCDMSYQKDYKNAPTVERPLIAAIWELNCVAMVNILMNLKTDVHKLYSPEKDFDKTIKPLFFYLICSPNHPQDYRIIHRVLKECNLFSRNRQGQTIIYEAILRNKPVELIQIFFNNGLDISMRDSMGRTARKFAQKMNKPVYVDFIDQYVLRLVAKGDTAQVQNLILKSYEHINDLKDPHGNSLIDIARDLDDRDMVEILTLCTDTQALGKKLFEAIKEGTQQEVRQLMCKKFAALRDKCGRSVLHYALLYKQKDISLYLIKDYTELANESDSMGRTPLHYAYVLFEEEPEVAHFLKLCGADIETMDNRGKSADSYRKCSCVIHFACIKKSIVEFDLEVFLEETEFEDIFFNAIDEKNITLVKELIKGLEDVQGVSRYSSRVLFACLDNNEEELAKFLVLRGFRTNIWKQYVTCSSDNPLCGMMECGHTVTYFKEKVKELQMMDLLQLINDIENGKITTAHSYPDPPVYCP